MSTPPPFPFPHNHWIGLPSSNPRNHSGCYGGPDKGKVHQWQMQMRRRGWKLSTDGCYGAESAGICRQFQAEKGLPVDGHVGPRTWWESWHAPISHHPHPPAPAGGWRTRSANWHGNHLGITEQPAGSNSDHRADGIRHAQDLCAGGGHWLRNQPWCGCWAFMGLRAAGKVDDDGSASWMAAVAAIEDHARKGLGPFRAWTTNGNLAKVGDLVVLFGRGVHVGTVRAIDASYAYTWEGNTSSGSGGSQANGGGSYARARSRRTETYGYALVK